MSDEPQDITLDTLRAELDAARREMQAARREALAARYGLPAELAGLLRGENPQQMEREAAALAAALNAAQTRSVSAGHPADTSSQDLTWIRERFTGQQNPFGRGGVVWGTQEE